VDLLLFHLLSVGNKELMLELSPLDALMDISDHSLFVLLIAITTMITLLDFVTKDAQVVILTWDSIVINGGGHMPEVNISTFQVH
jgi:hypothetical protein